MVCGGYFGDLDIIFKRKRRYSIISCMDSDFLTMTKSIFETTVVKEYPEIYEEMAFIAFEREKRIQAAKKIAILEYEDMIKDKSTIESPYRKYKKIIQALKDHNNDVENFETES